MREELGSQHQPQSASEIKQKKLTNWKNEPTLKELKGDLESAKTFHDNQMSKIEHWTDLLMVQGKAKPPKVKGRSSVQPKLIRRQAEWRYSALTEPFLSTERLFSVTPRTFEDADAAKQNELLLNWQFYAKINKIKFIDDFIRTVVDEGTGIIRVGWNRQTETVQEEVPEFAFYPIEDEQSAQMLQQAIQLKQSNPRGYQEQIPEEVKAAVEFFEEQQIPTIAQQVGSQTVETERFIENCPTVEVLNPQNVYIDPSCNGELDKALFVVVTFETNRADLEKAGIYKNLDQVNWQSSVDTEPDYATETPMEFRFNDPARKKVVAYEYWGFYDINNDNVLVPIVATWIGNVLIRMEENPFPDGKLPFVLVQYLPVKRSLYGEPDAELLEDNQRILGAVTRGMIDSLGRSANAQQGFAKGMLDPLNKRRFENGEDYEFNPNVPPQQGHIEHTYPELPQSAILMVQMQNQEAESLTGVKAFSGGLAGDAYNSKVATAIRGVLDAASKREMAILRRIAKGVSEVGEKIIAMNAEFLSDEEVVRVTNREFITIKREDIKGNFDLEVDISTAEVDNAKAQDMGFMLQTLGNNMAPEISLMILSEIADLKRMPELAEKIRNYKPQPNPVQEQAQQLELQRIQLENQKLQLESQKLQLEAQKIQQEIVKIQAETQKAASDAQLAQQNAILDAEKTKSDIIYNQARAKESLANADAKDVDTQLNIDGTKHRREMQKQKAQSRGNQNLEITKALLKPLKPEESNPNIDEAIGYNALTDLMNEE